MEAKFGVFSNQKALLVTLAVTHAQLSRAEKFNPESLSVKGAEDKVTFRLYNAKETALGTTAVSFPFQSTEEPAKVIFQIDAEDVEEAKIKAAKAIEGLKTIEAQVKASNEAIDKTLKGVEELA